MLQECLVKECKTLFQDFYLKNPAGQLIPLQIYSQFLPSQSGTAAQEPFPYLRVIVMDGKDAAELEANQCRIYFMAGVWNDSSDHQGYRDVLNILQKIYEHLMRDRVYQNRFQVEYPVKWRLEKEDLWPKFYGKLKTVWTLGKVTKFDQLT